VRTKANGMYEMEVTSQLSKGFQTFKARFEKMTPEEKSGFPSAIQMWNKQEKELYRQMLMADEEKREKFIEAKLASGEIKEVGIMGDLHATYYDATHIYDFLANTICLDLSDITIMSTKSDYKRLFNKPTYEGDFLQQMFDWNQNADVAKVEQAEVRDGLRQFLPKADESWE